MTLTQEQQSIVAAIGAAVPGTAIKVQAFAGTGKTSTLRAAALTYPERRFLYLVFNRAAALEAQARMPGNVVSRTMHAIAYKKLGYAYRDRLGQNNWALLKYMREDKPIRKLLGHGNRNAPTYLKILQTLKNFMADTSPKLVENHVPRWCEPAKAPLYAATAKLLWTAMTDLDGAAPVTHDVYLKLFYLTGQELAPPEWTVMLDEAQDADPVTMALVERHSGPRVMVGDNYQQLYQWRGAINALKHARGTTREYALTQTFRFGRETAAWANRILEAAGERMRIKPAGHSTPAVVGETDYLRADAILTRSNAGACDAALGNLRRGRRVFVQGGCETLIELLQSAWGLYSGNHRFVTGELAIFKNWQELEQAAGKEEDGTADPGLQILMRLIKRYQGRIPSMCGELGTCEKSIQDADLVVSTVHKAKGLEWQNVSLWSDFAPFAAVVDDGRLRFKYDEACVTYVALTRARGGMTIHPELAKNIEKSEELIDAAGGIGQVVNTPPARAGGIRP